MSLTPEQEQKFLLYDDIVELKKQLEDLDNAYIHSVENERKTHDILANNIKEQIRQKEEQYNAL